MAVIPVFMWRVVLAETRLNLKKHEVYSFVIPRGRPASSRMRAKPPYPAGAGVTGRNYPYTVSAGNFTFAPDGAVWTCSGFASYAYRSTNNGHSYTAFDLVARMPTNYFSFFSAIGQTPLGKVFSILATPQNQIIIGTETSGQPF